MDRKQLERIFEIAEIKEIPVGHYLFLQGDSRRVFYLVLSGRMRAVRKTPEGQQILGDISEGEPVGEFALFTGEVRTASVIAIRQATVLELDESDYDEIMRQFPDFGRMLTRFIIERLHRNHFQQHLRSIPRNVAVILLDQDPDFDNMTADISATFAEMGIPIRMYGPENAGQDPTDFFSSIEGIEGINFLLCNQQEMAWSRQCILYSDVVIVAVDFSTDAFLRQIEHDLEIHRDGALNKPVFLLLLHPQSTQLPAGTSKWLDNRKVDLHLHLRKGYPADLRRFCRIISRRAVGIVFGGGGAKGFAHVGAMKALAEAGVEVDFVGGTSAGTLYGLGMAFADFDMDRIMDLCRDSGESGLTSNDYNIPMISLMTGRKMRNYLRDMMGETGLEDFWVTSYCVSTDYSNASTFVHRTGVAWKQFAASIAIPGVFPPVIINGHLHLDGGVVDNVPVEPMYDYPVEHIIAIALTGLSEQVTELEEVPSAWSLFWDKLLRRKQYRLPGLASILINSLTLNSRQRQESFRGEVTLYMEMDLKGVGMMDGSKWPQIIEKGYTQMQKYLESLSPDQRFWRRPD